jgi:two-component system, OmpR family, response regulator
MSHLLYQAAGRRLPKVLVVDDEPQLRKALVNYLQSHKIKASGVATRMDALRAISTQKPDLVLLDINLGDDDGLEILRGLRTLSALPVILITGSLQDCTDRVIGLELGADDYLLKPFDMRELVARVRSILRRSESDRGVSGWPNSRCYAFCGWTFDQRTRRLIGPNKRDVGLTKSEFSLLSTFVSAPFQAFSRQQLLQAMRVHDEIVDRSIDVLILRLRRKLDGQSRSVSLIQTQRGVGYAFHADVTVQ